ncbi:MULTISPECIES: glycine cleavage system protein GcvH [Nannocystis]|uniref:Glycine cleavage system H protein n=1 Tax=Nannocystis radixulma TaxID=2995305 RepID=A0ABT5BJJ6_9BACT|nr:MULTISPECIES: glycine cleavage system protein GcvH [Nannocystis]MCY1053453.1 glycine cleavage system protein GcvH [Nannocystis sp. SCPEA4]MDC0674329.1 glycine cleavage system protein GcvH [Nannocystis radixulma]
MSDIPRNLRYTKDHEWARLEADGTVVVGITAHAVDNLGDVTVVGLPTVGARFSAGDSFGTVDSVKAVSELYAPLDGEVVAINERLNDTPELVNTSCYGDGWMIQIRPADPRALDGLLDADQYEAHLKSE